MTDESSNRMSSDVMPKSTAGITKPKRKKTSRACNHCHKAHMTCDSGRPCKRCIQRGLSKSCEDAPRKRKKYLVDVPNNVITKRGESASPISGDTDGTPIAFENNVFTNGSMSNNYLPSGDIYTSMRYDQPLIHQQSTYPPSLSQSLQQPMQQQIPGLHSESIQRPLNQQILPAVQSSQPQQHDPLQHQIHSQQQEQDQMVNSLQHQSQMLNSIHEPMQQPIQQSIQQPMQQPIQQAMQQSMQQYNSGRRSNFLSSAAGMEYSTLSNILQDNFGGQSTSKEGTPNPLSLSSSLQFHNHQAGKKNSRNHIPTYLSDSQTSSPNSPAKRSVNVANFDLPDYPKCDESINQYFLGPTDNDHVSMFPEVLNGIKAVKTFYPEIYRKRCSKSIMSFTIGIIPDKNNYTLQEHDFKEPEEIYAKVKHPFSYTPGYHSLIAYLRKRFPREMLVKMAESMAAYRPSFIACTNLLKEGDLIFMEQCFQRTLLTYDNLVRVSGTPTIVWRRTGEIAYVGNEFCILTGWSKEELLNQKKFIVELLDDESVVEYFQVFSRIAFGDFLGATMTECTLLTPDKDIKIRTGCIWTLKRDVFGIPMMIIGNFLPII